MHAALCAGWTDAAIQGQHINVTVQSDFSTDSANYVWGNRVIVIPSTAPPFISPKWNIVPLGYLLSVAGNIDGLLGRRM